MALAGDVDRSPTGGWRHDGIWDGIWEERRFLQVKGL